MKTSLNTFQGVKKNYLTLIGCLSFEKSTLSTITLLQRCTDNFGQKSFPHKSFRRSTFQLRGPPCLSSGPLGSHFKLTMLHS